MLLLIAVCGCSPSNFSNTKTTTELIKSTKWETIPKERIDNQQQKKGQALCNRILKACNDSYFKSFNSQEATQDLIEKITPEKITVTCKEIIKGYGNFEKTVFKEAQYLEKDGLTCYVFECIYEKKYYKKEIKIIFNESNLATNIATETIRKNGK
jgi:hypothetical protein